MKKIAFFFVLVLVTIAASACGGSASEETNSTDSSTASSEGWEPTKAIEIVAPSGAGGGWDTTARMAAKVFEEAGIINQNMGVINKPGGGGAVGWAYMAQKEGNPHHLFVNSPPILLIPLAGQSQYGHEDFTPLSNVIADYGAFAVHADAKWNNLNELFEDMKKDPESITVVGASSPGSMDHIQFVKIAKAAGVDIKKIKYVSDQEGGALTSLLNGSVDVYSAGIAETVEQVKAGKIKVLGITAEERIEGEVISDFPTAIEQGIDESFTNWRGFFGPPNMEAEEIAYYEEKFKELSDSEEFAEIRAQYGWDEFYLNSSDYIEFLDNEKTEIQTLLTELGY